MKQSHKIAIGVGAVVGIGAAVGSFLFFKKLKEERYFEKRRLEKDAVAFIREKYGEDALDGRRIQIIDEDQPITKTQIAEDLIRYSVQ